MLLKLSPTVWDVRLRENGITLALDMNHPDAPAAQELVSGLKKFFPVRIIEVSGKKTEVMKPFVSSPLGILEGAQQIGYFSRCARRSAELYGWSS